MTVVADAHWLELRDFLTERGAPVQRLLAPVELRELVPGIRTYSAGSQGMPVDVDSLDFAVLHKGKLDSIERRSLLTMLVEWQPVFANAVFVVYARQEFDGPPPEHMPALFAHVRTLLASLVTPPGDRGTHAAGPARHPEAQRELTLDQISSFVRLTNDSGHPNINNLWYLVKDIPAIRLNMKNFGYDLARSLRSSMQVAKVDDPVPFGITSKACTQADIESSWSHYWCARLRIPPVYHRKIWEFCFVLQALFEKGMLNRGRSGIGFGCGEEPLPSLFASMGMPITVTDLHPDLVAGKGWAETGQHTADLETCLHDDIVDRESFERLVSLKYVDMNQIPHELHGTYDFCWSICALEHLGSIDHGLDFIENSLSVLKDGGVAVHTTEFNYLNDEETIDDWQTVLFQRQHFEAIRDRLTSRGHTVAPLDFDVGNKPLDRFVDLPPYAFGQGWLSRDQWKDENQAAHLKLTIDGFPCTCFGMIIEKGKS
jgi:hypothetical protein